MNRNGHMLALLLAVSLVVAQAPWKTAFAGNVASVPADQIEVKPDGGTARALKVTPNTAIQRVAPGDKTLKDARIVPVPEVAKGDRVRVNSSSDLRRVVVMSSSDIPVASRPGRQRVVSCFPDPQS
jgi:hypothetical protein